MEKISSNVVWHAALIDRSKRALLNRHGSAVLWFTGLSGAGKSTLAHAVEERLYALQVGTYVLDGDNVRHGLCGDLGFSADDRSENIRRIGEVASLFVDAGLFVLTAFISPFRSDREKARTLIGPDNFIEIYCSCSVEVCETRDVKGLYKLARAGSIKEFTGISSPYEEPVTPALKLDTSLLSLDECADQVLALLHARGLVLGV